MHNIPYKLMHKHLIETGFFYHSLFSILVYNNNMNKLNRIIQIYNFVYLIESFCNLVNMVKNDTYFMKFALSQAKLAKENNEVPVGAVIVYKNNVISRAYNMVELLKDSTAHAEILAITSASDYLNSKYLQGCTLYTTLEPCVMCYGAIYWSKISRIVYAVDDPAKGYKSHKVQLNKKIQEKSGVLESESKDLIDKFFKKLRN